MMYQDKRKFLIVADNPEADNFWLTEELVDNYKFAYVKNQGSYGEESKGKEIAAVVMTDLQDSDYPGEKWTDKTEVIREAKRKGIPVLVMGSGDEIKRARNLGAVIMEKPSEVGKLIEKLRELEI